MKTKLIILLLTAGLLSACGSQPTESPVSPTDVPTEIPLPTDTVVVPTDTATPTETPTETPPAEPAIVSFDADVKPILQSRCFICHGGSRGTEEGLNLGTYDSLIAGSDNGLVITPGDAEGSLLIELIAKNEMPKRGPKLTPPQIQLITDWVNQGALNN